jgi:hypothetical protein
MRDRRALLISVRRAILRAALRAEVVLAMNADRNLSEGQKAMAARALTASALLIISGCFAVNVSRAAQPRAPA